MTRALTETLNARGLSGSTIPAVWVGSKRIRLGRELRCDDLAVRRPIIAGIGDSVNLTQMTK
jgi:hypothetical protein